MSFNTDQDYWTSCYANEQFIVIQTRSGNGMTRIDHLVLPDIFNQATDNETLGKSILQALSNSRTLIQGTPESLDFFNLEKGQQRYNNWVLGVCEKFGCKTKRTLFKKMKYCSIWLNNGRIEISPSRQVKLEAWDGINGVEDVVLSLDNSPEEIGAGLRLALSRCL